MLGKAGPVRLYRLGVVVKLLFSLSDPPELSAMKSMAVHGGVESAGTASP